jgi:8-oxo-dGTP pyrophosphatase MutT (NUDIX family)
MQVVYSQEPFPHTMHRSLFLAGPSPRNSEHHNWRVAALGILQELGYEDHVFIPLPRDGVFPEEYDDQVLWEQNAMDRSDVIVFWIPRDLDNLPGFTTNVEFGQRYRNHNVVLGFPQDAPKMRYLEYLAQESFVRVEQTLSATLNAALKMIDDSALREGGETQVPLHLWRLPHFQNWLQGQKRVGNRLDGCHVEMIFGVGPRKKFLLYWVAHMNIYVAAENRNKTNEIVISRPDIMHIVGYRRVGHDLLNTEILLVREFRSTANTKDGFIREVPGGSGFKPKTPLEDAVQEFMEETGISIEPSRLRHICTRQLSGTTTAHTAHCFAVELNEEEMKLAHQKQADAVPHGIVGDTERTYVEVWTLSDLLSQPTTDWSNLGMIFAAIQTSTY